MLYEKITENELKMLDTYRDLCADSEEQEVIINADEWADIKYVLREWEESKATLFKMFGEELILTKQFSYNRPKNEIKEEMEQLLRNHHTYGRKERSCCEFYQQIKAKYNEISSKYWDSHSVFEDCDETDSMYVEYIAWEDIYYLFNTNTLVDNIMSHTIELTNPKTNKPLKLQKGMKVIKAFGKLAEAFDFSGFEDFRICHSQVLNQTKLTGEMCLSIHPLDYWTMSDNNCGWHSCMSWKNIGDYRQGTVEMMNSPTVIVAYLKANDDMILSYGEDAQYWNSKKWRKLFIIDEKCIVGVKDYPYENSELSHFVMEWLKELATTNLGYSYKDNMIKYHGPGLEIKATINGSEEQVYFDFTKGLMYSDFGRYNEMHDMYLASDIQMDKAEVVLNRHFIKIEVPYSGESQCMVCGSIDNCIEHSSNLACEHCLSELHYCCECDCSSQDCEMIEYDGCWYCYDCYDQIFRTCEFCGNGVHERDVEGLYIIPRLTAEEMNERRSRTSGVTRDKVFDDNDILFYYSWMVDFCSSHCMNNWLKEYGNESTVLRYAPNGQRFVFADELNSEKIYNNTEIFINESWEKEESLQDYLRKESKYNYCTLYSILEDN